MPLCLVDYNYSIECVNMEKHAFFVYRILTISGKHPFKVAK